MAGPALAPESGEVRSARGRVSVGLLDGGTIWDAGRRILDRHPLPPDAPVVAVELADDLSAAHLHLSTAGSARPSEVATVALADLADDVLSRRPAAVAVQLVDRALGVDCFGRFVATWLESGVHVALVAGDHRVRDTVLVKFAELRPGVELSTGSTRAAVWSALTDQIGDLVDPHRTVVEEVIQANESLAMLLATALEPWLGQGDVPLGAMDEALRTVLAKHVLGLTGDEAEEAFAFIFVVVGACPAVDTAAASLGLCPHRALDLRRSLIEAGLGVGTSRRRELAVTGLLRLMPRTSTRRAMVTLRELLVAADLDPETCLDVLATVHSEAEEKLVRLVHDTVRSVPQDQRASLLAALLPVLAAGSSDPVRSVVRRVRSRRVDALRVPIQVAAESDQLTDPLEGSSLLVSLEHPREVASWADRILADETVDDGLWTRAALARTVVGGSSADHRDRVEVIRRPGLSRKANRLLDVVQTAMASFTMAARESELLEVAAHADDLALDDFPTDVGCLVAGACLAIDDDDLADRWTWLVRAQAEPSSVDHGYAQLLKSYCELSRGDLVRARGNALAAQQTFVEVGAVALAAVAGVTVALCHNRGGRPPVPTIRGDAHAFLVGLHHYFAAQISLEEDPGLDVVNVFFDVGRRLRAAGLDNPGLLKWREHLIRIFDEKAEPQIAECLRTDLRRAETQWAVHNPRSAGLRRATAALGSPSTYVGARGLSAISASEMRVVERVVAGDTNPRAAAALFLSKRTVDTHLRNVYRRLGITSRDELRELVHGAQPEPEGPDVAT